MTKTRRGLAFVILFAFVVIIVQVNSFQPVSAAGASWTFLELFSSPSCDQGQLGLKTVVNGLATPSSPYRYDSIVSQGGKVYSDILQAQVHNNGDILWWAPQGQNDRGMKNHNYPLTPGIPATFTLTLRKMDNSILWRTVVTIVCNTGVVHVMSSSSDPAGSGGGSFWDPVDDRIDPRAGDRLAVWCNTTATPPNIVVYGVDGNQPDDQKGFYLATFANADLLKAGPKGLTQTVTGGTVSMMQDGSGHFYVAWNDGRSHPSNQGDYAKSFTCAFSQ